MRRTHWAELSDDVRDAIQSLTGPVLSARTVTEGLNSALAAELHTSSGLIFVKGLPTDHPGVVTQQREAMINPYVLTVAPRLLWQTEAEGWNLLAFDYIQGRHADYTPGSEDLPEVVDVMSALGQIPCPNLPLTQAERRWADYVDDNAALNLLRGDSLLHTDFNPLNVLLSGETKHIIDWAWPTRGAAWIDPACFILRLIAAGHTPVGAESWAARTAAWTTASTDVVTMFAEASSRMWAKIAQDDPQPWKKQMASGARSWANYRLSLLAN